MSNEIKSLTSPPEWAQHMNDAAPVSGNPRQGMAEQGAEHIPNIVDGSEARRARPFEQKPQPWGAINALRRGPSCGVIINGDVTINNGAVGKPGKPPWPPKLPKLPDPGFVPELPEGEPGELQDQLGPVDQVQ